MKAQLWKNIDIDIKIETNKKAWLKVNPNSKTKNKECF